jgi:ATP-dependent Lhr-like helicase
LRRSSLARLRAEVEPVEPAALGRFLPSWHGIGRKSRSAPTADDVLSAVEQLAGAPIPASALESLVLPARLPGYSPALLDELTAAGEVTWCGTGALAGGDGWIALAPADVADLLLPDVEDAVPDTPLHTAVLSALDGGALFFRQVVDRTAAILLDGGAEAPTDPDVVAAIWDLVWGGMITNDTIAPLRALVSGKGAAHRPRRTAPRGRYARLRTARPAMPSRTGPPTVGGRWSLVDPREPDPTRRAHARAEAFLERHGVLTRGALDTERVTGGFSGIYKVLRTMEESGQVIRGYVIEGLGASQFAARGAVDRLRALSRSDTTNAADSNLNALILATTDPAQPYGAALPWPEPLGDGKHRPGRKAGALVVLIDGVPTLYVERGGRSLLSFTDYEPSLHVAATALSQAVHDGRLNSLSVQKADGETALTSTLSSILRDAGFRATPKGLRLRA